MKFSDFTSEQQKAVDNLRRVFNRKRTMLIRRNSAIEPYLPPKLTRKTFETEVESPGDFDLTYRVYHSFLKKDAEKQIQTETRPIINWDVERTRMYVEQINANRRETFEDLSGQKYATLLAQYHMLNDKDIANMNPDELLQTITDAGVLGNKEQHFQGGFTGLLPKRMKSPAIIAANYDAEMTKLIQQSRASYYQSRIEQYKTNYLQAIKNSYGFFDSNGEFTGMSEQAWEFYEYIQNMEPRNLLAASYTDEKLKLRFNYEPQKANELIQEITENWMDYFYSNKATAVEKYAETVGKNVNELEFNVGEYLDPTTKQHQ